MRFEDQIILREINLKNTLVFRRVFDEYHQMLLRFSEKITFDGLASEDIVQAVFINLWEKADQVCIEKSLKAFLIQSVRNRSLNYLRDMKVYDKHRILYIESACEIDDPELMEEVELDYQVHCAINLLPEAMANIVRLRYVDGLKNKEIAKKLGITENTVKTHLVRARDRLRSNLLESTGMLFTL